jgi:hypothetical protein
VVFAGVFRHAKERPKQNRAASSKASSSKANSVSTLESPDQPRGRAKVESARGRGAVAAELIAKRRVARSAAEGGQQRVDNLSSPTPETRKPKIVPALADMWEEYPSDRTSSSESSEESKPHQHRGATRHPPPPPSTTRSYQSRTSERLQRAEEILATARPSSTTRSYQSRTSGRLQRAEEILATARHKDSAQVKPSCVVFGVESLGR